MLTTYQAETVAFILNGRIVCPDCAVRATSALTVAKAKRGDLSRGHDPTPLSRYSLHEFVSAAVWDYASQESEGEEETERLADEILNAGHPCDDCGRPIS